MTTALGGRVLVVDDDHRLRDLIARGLRGRGFDVVTASDGAGALQSLDPPVDAVVLDVGLPDSDGRDVCQALRARGVDAPVIFLTARGEVDDRLSGFAAGGDDYLVKPFAFAELVARLTALLRRHVRQEPSRSGALSVDPVRHGAVVDDQAVDLSPIEFHLLARLAAGSGAVVRRGELRQAAWPAGAVVADNTLDQYVTKLRRKLAALGARESIVAVRGVGYRLVEDPDR